MFIQLQFAVCSFSLSFFLGGWGGWGVIGGGGSQGDDVHLLGFSSYRRGLLTFNCLFGYNLWVTVSLLYSDLEPIEHVPRSCCVYDPKISDLRDASKCQTWQLGPPGNLKFPVFNDALHYDVSLPSSTMFCIMLWVCCLPLCSALWHSVCHFQQFSVSWPNFSVFSGNLLYDVSLPLGHSHQVDYFVALGVCIAWKKRADVSLVRPWHKRVKGAVCCYLW